MSKNTSAKTLVRANKHLRNTKVAKAMRARSIASSTAIETGASISDIETKIIREHSAHYHVELA